MKRDRTQAYIGVIVYGIAAALCAASCLGCTSTQRETFKSHGLETGIAAGGGALAVATGGAAAIPIVLGGMATAAFVGEINKPPQLVEHTTTIVNQDGKILSQKTTTSAVKPQESAMEFFTTRNIVIIALILLAFAFPATRALAIQALSGLVSAARAAPGWIASHLKSLRTQKRPERKATAQMRSAHAPQPNDPINPQ